MLNNRKKYKKQYYLNNKKHILYINKLWREKNKEKIKEKRKIYILNNKEKIKKEGKIYRIKNKKRIKKLIKLHRIKNRIKYNLYQKKWTLKNKEKRKMYAKKHYLKYKDIINNKKYLYKKQKYKKDVAFRLKALLRTRIIGALRGINKSNNTLNLLGIPNIEFLKKYLENKFKPGMSWEKRNLIHIDHIIPCKAFDLTDPKQQAKCFHYTNLQPLWAHENLSKSSKIL